MSGLRKLAADLRKAARSTPGDLGKTTFKAGMNIKKDASRRVRARTKRSAPDLGHAIDFDVSGKGTAVQSVEVGYNKARYQVAPLGLFPEFGHQPHNTGRDLEIERSLHAEVPKYEQALGDIGDYGIAR